MSVLPPAQRAQVTASLLLGTIMITLDSTIANVALPQMQGSLSAAQDQITWVLTSYIISQALMTPLIGVLAERFGRKQLMLASIIGFTAASLACGLALDLPSLVLFRLLQGMAGAALMPLSQAILFDINPPEKHFQAMSIFSGGSVLGPVFGPIIGGWLTEQFDWRWIFLINLPLGVIAIAGIWATLPEQKSNNPRRFDFIGFGSLSVFIASMQLMLDRGPSQDWLESWEIAAYALFSGIGLFVFLLQTATAEHPFFDRSLLRNGNFVFGCLISIVTGWLLYSSMALLPQLMQQLMGYPVITTGFVTMPRGVGMLIALTWASRYAVRVDPRLIVITGFVLNAVACWQMSQFSLEMDDSLLVISALIQGTGLGLAFVASSTLAFASVTGPLRTDAASIFTLTRNLGASVGISIMQALLLSNLAASYAEMSEHIRPDNPTIGALAPGQIDFGSAASMTAVSGEITRQAAMVAYIDDFKLAMLLALAAMPLALLLRAPGKSSEAPVHSIPD